MERSLGYLKWKRQDAEQGILDVTIWGWAQALRSTLTKAGVPELLPQEGKGPEVKESLENIKSCHFTALKFCGSVRYVKGSLGNWNFRETLGCQAEELELYHRQWSLLNILSRECFSINVYFMRVKKKKCYLLCKNAPGRILVKLIALIASGKGI